MKSCQRKMNRVWVAVACMSLLAAMLLSGCGNASSSGNNASKGYVFTLKGLDLYIGQSLDIMGAYGTPVGHDESEACGGIPGKDCVYVYSGVTIKTTPAKGGENVICMIELTDDTYKIPEGLTIGATANEVKDKMGNKGTETDTALTYAKDGMKLVFILRNGLVTNIQYQPQ